MQIGFLLPALLLLLRAVPAGEPRGSRESDYQDFALQETAGIERRGEPVRIPLRIPLDAGSLGTARLWDRTNGRYVPVQLSVLPKGVVEILFIAAQPAGSKIEYRLYLGGTRAGAPEPEGLRVRGEDLAWQVENRHFIVDLTRNPGTGRSGQINRIFAKRPGIWLSREREQSTLHLSPNAASRQHYLPINRWDPPERWTCTRGLLSFRLERSGPMPRLPQLRARVVYEIYADSPQILVEEEIEALQAVDLTLLRLGEFTFAPDPSFPFTDIAWGKGAQSFLAGRNESPELPADLSWLGFVRRPANYGFASVSASLQASTPAGDPARLLNPGAAFSGTPAHYFSRVLITNSADEWGPAITIPAGSRYRLQHRIYWLEPSNKDPLRSFSDFWRSLEAPLRVRLAGKSE